MKIFILENLSDSILVYNAAYTLVKKIKPNPKRMKRDVVISCFSFSERQERVGAVLKDLTMVFWDNSDNFQYEKLIATCQCVPECQTSIWYLEYFNSWITADKSGFVYVWDLETERPERRIKLVSQTEVNDLAVIPCINFLAVVQARKIYFEERVGKERRRV
jgi:WD40 repeat protein